jgi:hypothetical protein
MLQVHPYLYERLITIRSLSLAILLLWALALAYGTVPAYAHE